MATKMDEENDERRKELGLMRNQLQKEREEMRGQLESDTAMVLKQLEKDSNEIMGLIKKERSDRERDGNTLKERIDNERKEMQILIDKDRDDTNRKLKEEHDQRRIEQMELVQRLDNNEKCGKNDITVNKRMHYGFWFFDAHHMFAYGLIIEYLLAAQCLKNSIFQDIQTKLKREHEDRENELDDLRNKVINDKSQLEEKIIKERQALRDAFDSEQLDINKRVDKVNSERMSDMAEVQAKMALVGKSASRHLDTLRAQLFRECQTLFELATKPCSVVFDAFREDNYSEGGEDYLTFTGTTVNIGQAMNPKSGEFVTPEPGLYLFLVTCCTFDMKKCLISIRKNGKDVANIFDQDGDTNKVRSY